MGSSKRFFIALPAGLIFFLGSYLALFRVQLGTPTESSRWCYEITQKKRTLAASFAGPRLLLVGGSSVHFGMNASAIAETVGKPTINLGNHAALGPAYTFYELRRTVRTGDTVLLALEYEYFSRNGTDTASWNDPLYIDYIVSRDPAYFRTLPVREQFELIMTMPLSRLAGGVLARFRTPAKIELPEAYDPARMDTHGDATGHTYETRRTNAPPIRLPIELLLNGPPPTDTGWVPIGEFCRWARTNGIQVLATFPPVVWHPAYSLPPAQRTIDRIQAFYKKLGVPVLEPAPSVMLPADRFYDTRYHPVEEEQLARTLRLLPRLTSQMGNTSGQR